LAARSHVAARPARPPLEPHAAFRVFRGLPAGNDPGGAADRLSCLAQSSFCRGRDLPPLPRSTPHLWTGQRQPRRRLAGRLLFRSEEQPIVFLVWHNRLFVVAEIYRRFRGRRPTYGLVSASRDGAWLAAFFSLMGLKAVRG